MRIHYTINCPNNLLRGTIPLNGALLYWACLSAFPNITNKQNIWLKAKHLCKNALSGNLNQANATRLFTFITFNKLYNMQGLFFYRITPQRNFYICYDVALANNDYYGFVIYTSQSRRNQSLSFAQKAPGVYGGQTHFCVAFYDVNNHTVQIDDPPSNDARNVDLRETMNAYKQRMIDDLLKLKPSGQKINNEQYLVANLGEDDRIGLSQAFIHKKDVWFTAKQTSNSETFFKNIYINVKKISQ